MCIILQDALAKAGNVTVIHLISFSQKKGSTAKLLVNDGKQRGVFTQLYH